MGNCSHYSNGSYNFGDEGCWFNHSIGTDNQSMIPFNCSFCGKSFASKADIMKHKKKQHLQQVKYCKNITEEKCNHGSNCWFKHENNETKENSVKRIKC